MRNKIILNFLLMLYVLTSCDTPIRNEEKFIGLWGVEKVEIKGKHYSSRECFSLNTIFFYESNGVALPSVLGSEIVNPSGNWKIISTDPDRIKVLIEASDEEIFNGVYQVSLWNENGYTNAKFQSTKITFYAKKSNG